MTPEEQRKAALSEVPSNWVNRDYDENQPSPPPRRWLIWTAASLMVLAMMGGLWETLKTLLK